MTVDVARTREMAARYTAAWCSQDPASVAEFFAPDGSLRVNDSAPAVGRTAIAAVAQGFMTAFPDMQVSLDDVAVDGDVVIYRWTLVGTNTGPGGTGQHVRIQGYEEWRLGHGDVIASSLGHFDADEYARQVNRPRE